MKFLKLELLSTRMSTRLFTTSQLLQRKINLKELREKSVDWERQARLGYVVLDPVDNSQGLIYMTESEYLKLNRTCISSGIALTVVCRPGDEPPVTPESSEDKTSVDSK
jgi:hypothetical protein